jgi:hypothetical protein
MSVYHINAPLETNKSLAASFETSPVDGRDYHTLSIQCVWTTTNTPVGELQLQVSDNGVNFEDEGNPIELGSATQTSIANFQFVQRYWRVQYTRSSGGTGATMNIIYTMKAK